MEFKWIGFGLGPSLFFHPSSSSSIVFFPNAHLRIGAESFNVQAGISDRYIGVHNPISLHLSFCGSNFKNNTQIQIGIMNQFSEFPLPTAGFFMKLGNYSKSFSILAGESGASIAINHDFLK